MNHDYLFAFFHFTIGFTGFILMDNLKKFVLSKPEGRRLVTADIQIIQATAAQVARHVVSEFICLNDKTNKLPMFFWRGYSLLLDHKCSLNLASLLSILVISIGLL